VPEWLLPPRQEFVALKGRSGSSGSASSPAITVDMVLATAMTMIEEAGVDAFSMRKLAAELGVGTPTVYWHVGNRDELFNRLIEEITDQFGRIAPRGRTPVERITSISDALLREVRARPQLIALSRTQGRGEAIFTKAQAVLAHELTASGLHGEEAAFAVATILFHLGGYIVLEDALSPDYRVRGAQVWAEHDKEIDETMSTVLQKEVDLDRIFRFTLDAILQSILDGSKPRGAGGT
jgi:AcrR family transcriptional regulator